MSTTVTKAAGVTVDKPWYLSKKIWLLTIALGLALYQALTGQWENLTPEQLASQVAETATWLGPIVTAILAIAHVDGKTRWAALIRDALKAASELDDKDTTGPGGGAAAPPS